VSKKKEILTITIEIISDDDSWQLEVVNTVTGKAIMCENLDKMNEAIETFQSLYTERELQVMWLSTTEAKDEHIEEIRVLIGEIQAELDANKS
jgi:wyosine [tRNA(Phe)-imidazoG37] synthetase (radical SAM superfamily)